MQLQFLLPAFAAIASLSSVVQASPVPCPDSTRDAILNGFMSPEACCSYGVCKGDVVVQSG